MPGTITISDAILDLNENGDPKYGSKSYQMADDGSVGGFGSFIDNPAAEKMAREYMNLNDEIHGLLVSFKQFLNDPSALSPATKTELLTKLENVIEVTEGDNDNVAGTYGKELLLNLLSRPDCEGLRYVCCRYKKKNSILLYPVDSEGLNQADQEYYKAINNNESLLPATDMKGEVKGRPTTRDTILHRTNMLEQDGFVNELGSINNKNYFKGNSGAVLFLTPDQPN